MSTRKIVITVIAVFLAPIIIFVALWGFGFMIEDGFFENYSGWKEVEIPTETELKAKIRLPQEWKFIVDNGRIKIIDNEDKVIAVECFEDWRCDYYKGSIYYNNDDELDFNSEISEPYRNLKNYEEVQGQSTVTVNKIIVDSKETYALELRIMDSVSEDGTYILFLVFDNSINDIDVFDKMQKSYRWAGWIDE